MTELAFWAVIVGVGILIALPVIFQDRLSDFFSGVKRNVYDLGSVKTEINELRQRRNYTPRTRDAIRGFWQRTCYAVRLIFVEKELIVFALLQWLCIALVYYLWIQIMDWIPESVWETIAESESGSVAGSIVNILFVLWSFVCVGLVAFPIGIFSACMGAVHFLHKQGRESTIASCLKIVMPRAWPLWIFQWADAWWTVIRILDRLPKKNDRRTFAQKAFSESLYYAWKIGTTGIFPALVTGRSLRDASRHSLNVLRYKFEDITTLRLGYSASCWIVGILSYIGAILFFLVFPDLVNREEAVTGQMFPIYFWLAVPLLVSVGVVMLFLRPIYVISACDIYSEFVEETREKVMLPTPASRGMGALVVFAIVCTVVLVVFLYRYELGVMDKLATPVTEGYLGR